MTAALELGDIVGKVVACRALGVLRAMLYRRMLVAVAHPARPTPARALCAGERRVVLDHLYSQHFCDKAPVEVFATLQGEDIYLCSIHTVHRILVQNKELKERRNQLRHPQYKKPELLATGPNQVWSWDITKLLGPAKWSYFDLYVILDIFSRYVVCRMVAPRETAELDKRLIAETCAKQGIVSGHFIFHTDRGTFMTSTPVALLMADLDETKTHSRLHVSDDNPYSESRFKTLKYMPDFSERNSSIEDARASYQRFFPWYNQEHQHSGIALLTPEMLHYGRAGKVIGHRQLALDAAYARNPKGSPTADSSNRPSTPQSGSTRQRQYQHPRQKQFDAKLSCQLSQTLSHAPR